MATYVNKKAIFLRDSKGNRTRVSTLSPKNNKLPYLTLLLRLLANLKSARELKSSYKMRSTIRRKGRLIMIRKEKKFVGHSQRANAKTLGAPTCTQKTLRHS